jgi:hypothetical protein
LYAKLRTVVQESGPGSTARGYKAHSSLEFSIDLTCGVVPERVTGGGAAIQAH